MGQKVMVSVSFDAESDRDLLRWLGKLEKGQRSAAIRGAIRDHLGRGGVSLGDVYQAVVRVERRLEGAVIGDQGTGGQGDKEREWEEPPEAAAALNALGQV